MNVLSCSLCNEVNQQMELGKAYREVYYGLHIHCVCPILHNKHFRSRKEA